MSYQSRHSLPCVACGKALDNVFDNVENQPSGATAFVTHGHYGSTIFDPINGSYLELNVCDECLRRLAGEGKVFLGHDSKPVVSYVGPEEIRHVPTWVGSVRVERRLVPWHPGEEAEGEEERVVLEPEEIGSDTHPEVEYGPGILERYKPGKENE